MPLKELLAEADRLRSSRFGQTSGSPVGSDGRSCAGCSVYDFICSTLSLEGLPLNALQVRAVLDGREDGFPTDWPSGFPRESSLALISGVASAWELIPVNGAMPQITGVEELLRRIHARMTQTLFPDSAGRYRTDQRLPQGVSYPIPDSAELPHLMSHFTDQLRASEAALHPIELAVFAHKRLIDLQPFTHYSGTAARLLMNVLLLRGGFPCICIPPEQHPRYLDALDTARRFYDLDALFELAAECVLHELRS